MSSNVIGKMELAICAALCLLWDGLTTAIAVGVLVTVYLLTIGIPLAALVLFIRWVWFW